MSTRKKKSPSTALDGNSIPCPKSTPLGAIPSPVRYPSYPSRFGRLEIVLVSTPVDEASGGASESSTDNIAGLPFSSTARV